MKVGEWIPPIIGGNLLVIDRQSDKQFAAIPQAKLSIVDINSSIKLHH